MHGCISADDGGKCEYRVVENIESKRIDRYLEQFRHKGGIKTAAVTCAYHCEDKHHDKERNGKEKQPEERI